MEESKNVVFGGTKLGYYLNFASRSLIILLFAGCATTMDHSLIYDPGEEPIIVESGRVAIVSSETLDGFYMNDELEMANWQIVRELLEKQGYTVVDFQTSKMTFRESGILLDNADTKMKQYYQLADNLNVDFLIVPYYGLHYSNKRFFFVSHRYFQAMSSFRVYSRSEEAFIGRVDIVGENSITIGYITPIVATTLWLLRGRVLQEDVYYTTGIIGALELLLSIELHLQRSNDFYWSEVFQKSIPEGFEEFLRVFPKAKE